MSSDWGTEAFEGHFSDVLERKTFADAQLSDCIRHQNLFRLCVRAQAGRELDSCSKEIIVLLDRFAGCGADSNLERAIGICL